MDDDIIIEILKTVNNLPDLSQEYVIEEIKGELQAQRESKSGSGSYIYEICKGLEEIEFNINHPLVKLTITHK